MPIDRQATFSGTKDVAGALAIDAARLETLLASRLPDFKGPLRVRQFKGGQSNPTYLLETPRARFVLRRKPPGKLLPSAHAVDREFRVISALHAQGFPVAAPVLFCEDDGIVGTPFYVMGYVDGRVFWEPHMPDAEPGERAAVYDAMNATLARLHAFDPAALGLADFGRGENYVGASGRALVEAVPCLRDRKDRRDGAADRLAAGASAAAGAGAARARRLPARQHHPVVARARQSSRCSTGNCPRWAIRSPTSPIT